MYWLRGRSLTRQSAKRSSDCHREIDGIYKGCHVTSACIERIRDFVILAKTVGGKTSKSGLKLKSNKKMWQILKRITWNNANPLQYRRIQGENQQKIQFEVENLSNSAHDEKGGLLTVETFEFLLYTSASFTVKIISETTNNTIP